MRTFAAVVFALIVMVGAPARSAQAGACRPTTLSAVALASDATIVADGGALIGWGEDGAADDPALDRAGLWTLTDGTSAIDATVTTLAPGLLRVTPAPGARPVTLADDRGRPRMTVAMADAAPGALAPPRATVRTRIFHFRRGADGAETTARFARVPDLAVAVVMYRAGEDDAIAWARVGASKTVSLIATPGRCRRLPEGAMVPDRGERVQLAWVDRFGRLSPRSRPIAVR